MRNKYPGLCYRCERPVEPGDGHFERHGKTWRTQHAFCAIRWRGVKDVSVENARAAIENWQDAEGIARPKEFIPESRQDMISRLNSFVRVKW